MVEKGVLVWAEVDIHNRCALVLGFYSTGNCCNWLERAERKLINERVYILNTQTSIIFYGK